MFTLKKIPYQTIDDPKGYVITDEGLIQAINMAITLQKPLLISGSPGTGKTQLAFKVAEELAEHPVEGFAPFLAQPFVFNTKTSSTARDLFYHYDAIGHFQSRTINENALIEKRDTSYLKETISASASHQEIHHQQSTYVNTTPHPFIRLNPMGKAIVQSLGSNYITESTILNELSLVQNFKEIQQTPYSSVVLIDEIDKASRDFPNDLLNEIENYEFSISELGLSVEKSNRPDQFPVIVIIMTSNFENNLPDAFLRRCLFYHIDYPKPEQLALIVTARMGDFISQLYPGLTTDIIVGKLEKIKVALKHFDSWRSLFKDKVPAMSELLEWLRILELEHFFDEDVDFNSLTDQQLTTLRYSLPILSKSELDMQSLIKSISSADDPGNSIPA